MSSVLERRRPHVEVVLTGRYAPQEIIDAADLVTEMREIKHYYNEGVVRPSGYRAVMGSAGLKDYFESHHLLAGEPLSRRSPAGAPGRLALGSPALLPRGLEPRSIATVTSPSASSSVSPNAEQPANQAMAMNPSSRR